MGVCNVKKSCHPQRSLITVQNLPLKLCMFQVQAFLFIQIISRCFFFLSSEMTFDQQYRKKMLCRAKLKLDVFYDFPLFRHVI